MAVMRQAQQRRIAIQNDMDGIGVRTRESRPLFRNAFIKRPSSSTGRMRGGMPPPNYTPPVDITLSAGSPASAPKIETKISSVRRQIGQGRL